MSERKCPKCGDVASFKERANHSWKCFGCGRVVRKMRQIDDKEFKAPWCEKWCTMCKNYKNDDCESCGASYKVDAGGKKVYNKPDQFEEE